MNMRARKSIIKDGVLYINGQPDFCFSADYPYYRDHRADWAVQLSGIKKMGINYVSFYIPWRHHLPEDPLKSKGRFDFSGEKVAASLDKTRKSAIFNRTISQIRKEITPITSS